MLRCCAVAADLHEDLVLVHRNERAEAFWRQLVEHDRVGRLVAREDLVRE